jgi:transposase
LRRNNFVEDGYMDDSKPRKSMKDMPNHFQHLNPHAAGIDVGSRSHFVAVPEDADEKPVREFSCFTKDLHHLADWLHACGVKTVAMERPRHLLDSGV